MKVVQSAVFSTGHITTVEVSDKKAFAVKPGEHLGNGKNTWKLRKLNHWGDGGFSPKETHRVDLHLEIVNGTSQPKVGDVLEIVK